MNNEKHEFARKGYYMILGVDGMDTLYLEFEDHAYFDKAVKAVVQSLNKAKIQGISDECKKM